MAVVVPAEVDGLEEGLPDAGVPVVDAAVTAWVDPWMIQARMMSTWPLVSPVKKISWYPTTVSIGMVTVPMAMPSELAVKSPGGSRWSGYRPKPIRRL